MSGQAKRFSAIFASTIVWAAAKQALGGITQADLRAYTERAIQGGYVECEPPVFCWDDEGVRYILGGMVGRAPKIGWLITPLQQQCVVTGIRRYRTSPRQVQFWNPVLDRVETKIGEALAAIHAEKHDPAGLSKHLESIQEEIDSIYSNALGELAHGYGGTAVRCFRAECCKCRAEATTLAVTPANGEVAFITAGDWNWYIHFRDKEPIQLPQWEALPTGDCSTLYGKNWIWAKWPDGRYWVKLIDVGSAKSIIVKPSGVELRR